MPMTTLGLSTLLSGQRSVKNFEGLRTLGLIVFFVGLVQWVCITAAKILRFVLDRGSLRKSFTDPNETLFFATFWIRCYTVLAAGVDFAEPTPGGGLAKAFQAFFWIYLICAICTSVGLHLLLFHERRLEAKIMTPAWLLPVFPVILPGVLAGSVADYLTPPERYPVLIAGVICSSMGFLLSLPMDALYLHRLFVAGYTDTDQRPAMMIAVGPPCYAPLAFLKISKYIPDKYGFFEAPVQILAAFMSLAIFGLGLFFFMMAVCAIVWCAKRMRFHLNRYGFVFPNVGLLSTMGVLGVLGVLLPGDGVRWFASICTACLSAVWLFVTGMHVIAMYRHSEFLW